MSSSDFEPSENLRRSTGPRTPEGKARSSQNSQTHGCCSQSPILPDEDPDEYAALRQSWRDCYEPADQVVFTLVNNAFAAQWLTIRTTRRYAACEQRLFEQQPDALLWTEAQHRSLSLFLRYKTAAERQFHKALGALEAYRKNRVREEHNRRALDLRTAAVDLRRGALPRAQADFAPPSGTADTHSAVTAQQPSVTASSSSEQLPVYPPPRPVL